MPEGASFQPATVLDQEKATALRSAQRRFLGYDQQFVDGTETYYDDYAQAWRLIGFYIDCNAEEYEQEADDRRRLEGGDGGEDSACGRYLLWAAVSLNMIFDCYVAAAAITDRKSEWFLILNRFKFLLCSTLTWTIPEVASASTSSTTATQRAGVTVPVPKVMIDA